MSQRLRRNTPAYTAAALHQQASAWYARCGLFPEAIQHAIAGEVHAMAAQLIETHGQQLLAQGEFQSLLRWLRLLPAASLRARPRLIVSIGTVKKHSANIFGKLQVQSRTQAVARARTLGVL